MQLPANPQPADFVVLSSRPMRSSRLDAAKTAFADLVYLPIDTFANVELRWSKAYKRWDVIDGLTARRVIARGDIAVPQSEHAITQVYIGSQLSPVSMYLPTAAAKGPCWPWPMTVPMRWAFAERDRRRPDIRLPGYPSLRLRVQ